MVGAINAPETGNTFANFVQAAQSSNGPPGVSLSNCSLVALGFGILNMLIYPNSKDKVP